MIVSAGCRRASRPFPWVEGVVCSREGGVGVGVVGEGRSSVPDLVAFVAFELLSGIQFIISFSSYKKGAALPCDQYITSISTVHLNGSSSTRKNDVVPSTTV